VQQLVARLLKILQVEREGRSHCNLFLENRGGNSRPAPRGLCDGTYSGENEGLALGRAVSVATDEFGFFSG